MKKIINTLFLILLFANTSVFAATRTVCSSGGTYATIAAAITASGNGDEIVICPGTYNESLSFSQSNLTFRSSTGNRNDVKINNSNTVFTISGNSARLMNLSVTSTGNEAIVGAYAGRGSHTFQNLAVTSNGTAIHLNNGGPHTFKLSTLTSSNGGGISIEYVEDAGISNVFEDLTINVKNLGISVNRGAAQSMKNLVVNSSAGGGINIGPNADGAHIFENVTVTSQDDSIVAVRGAGSMKTMNIISSNGAGVKLGNKYAGVFQDLVVQAKNEGFIIYNQDSVSSPFSFNNAKISSSASQAIRVIRAGALTFTGITIDSAGGSSGDGLAVETADSVNVNNICVKSADRYGIRFDYNARNTSIKNAIIKGNASYGVYIDSDPSAVSHVNNSCFYKAPCAAAAWPMSARHFSGNYVQPGLACNNNQYVTMTAPLASCPVVESSCVSGVPVTNAPGGFNAYETATAAAAINGVIKTKIAGAQITLDAIVLNAANTAIATSFTGDVKVELIANINLGVALNAANCPDTSTSLTSQTLTFVAANAGRKNIVFAAVPNVYRDARIRLSYPATGTASTVVCSTDNFAIRPAQFAAVRASDADWQTAGTSRTLNNNASATGNVHKAGQPFTVQATAVNAATTAVTTSNYSGGPTAVVACTLPTPACVNGALDTGTWSSVSGTVTTSTAKYAEVGSFNLTLSDPIFANVDNKAGDSSAAEYTISSAPVSVGRFVPNHFTLVPQGAAPTFRTFNAECSARSFTYIGQPFKFATVPVALITAKNAANGTTYNYRGDLWGLGGENVEHSYGSNYGRDGDLKNTPMVTADNAAPGTGSITISSADQLKFLRSMITPQAPFNANISLSVAVREVVPGHGDIVSNAPAVFNGGGSGIAFDQGNLFRYGRMRVENASGSELLDMSIPIKTDYWNGSNFVLNAADNCTIISAANVALGPYGGGITAANMPASRLASGNPVLQGVGSVILRKPTPAPTAKGSVDVCIDLGSDTAPAVCSAASSALQPWLQGKWSEINYDDDPRGRATFGTNKSGPIIYMREIY